VIRKSLALGAIVLHLNVHFIRKETDMSITLYGYKKCSTSRKGEKALTDAGIEYTFIDVTENPPSKSAMKKCILQSNEPIKKFFNTSGQEYRNLDMKKRLPEMSEEEAIELLSSNGRLIKRPIVTDGEKTTVGYDEALFKKTWL
jgi:arsenate reductase (glutaredoxin)